MCVYIYYVQSWPKISAPLQFCQKMQHFSQKIVPIANVLVLTCLLFLFALQQHKKIVEKHGQSQDYKSISRDLNVPVSTVRNIFKRFTAHGTVANLPVRGRKSKINEKLQRRIVRMVDKEPRLTSKQIQADLQTQGTTMSARTIRSERGSPRLIKRVWMDSAVYV